MSWPRQNEVMQTCSLQVTVGSGFLIGAIFFNTFHKDLESPNPAFNWSLIKLLFATFILLCTKYLIIFKVI